jgi:PAS domain S-box-containing protein
MPRRGFRSVFESRAIGMTVFDATTGETLIANDRLLEMTGATRAAFELGQWDWRKVTPPEHLQLDERAIAEARARGWWDPYEKDYLRPDGSRLPVRISSAPLPGEPGRVVVLVQDISEQREAERRRDLLAREVDHRAKNMLAVVQAALRLTPKEDVGSYAREVEGRVGALARAHGLLADGRWTGAALHALITGELAAFLPGAARHRRRRSRSQVRISRFRPQRRRPWRWRCTSWLRTPRSMVPLVRRRSRWRAVGGGPRRRGATLLVGGAWRAARLRPAGAAWLRLARGRGGDGRPVGWAR